MGFESRACTPKHPEKNRIAKTYMSVLFKIIHVAMVDPQVEVKKHLINYRNTPHPSTGKASSELIIGRLLRKKIVKPMTPGKGKLHQKAMLQKRESRKQRKSLRHRKNETVHSNIKIADKILIKHQETTTKPLFDPKT